MAAVQGTSVLSFAVVAVLLCSAEAVARRHEVQATARGPDSDSWREANRLLDQAAREEALAGQLPAEMQVDLEEPSLNDVDAGPKRPTSCTFTGVKGLCMSKCLVKFVEITQEDPDCKPLNKVCCAKLPAGWVQYTDDNGNPYYYNEKLGTSQWEPPTTGTPQNSRATAPSSGFTGTPQNSRATAPSSGLAGFTPGFYYSGSSLYKVYNYGQECKKLEAAWLRDNLLHGDETKDKLRESPDSNEETKKMWTDASSDEKSTLQKSQLVGLDDWIQQQRQLRMRIHTTKTQNQAHHNGSLRRPQEHLRTQELRPGADGRVRTDVPSTGKEGSAPPTEDTRIMTLLRKQDFFQEAILQYGVYLSNTYSVDQLEKMTFVQSNFCDWLLGAQWQDSPQTQQENLQELKNLITSENLLSLLNEKILVFKGSWDRVVMDHVGNLASMVANTVRVIVGKSDERKSDGFVGMPLNNLIELLQEEGLIEPEPAQVSRGKNLQTRKMSTKLQHRSTESLPRLAQVDRSMTVPPVKRTRPSTRTVKRK